MQSRQIVEAWIALIALSLCTTALTLASTVGMKPEVAGAGVLLLAGAKARVILVSYLKLGQTRFWRTMFDVALVGFLSACFVIYLIGNRG